MKFRVFGSILSRCKVAPNSLFLVLAILCVSCSSHSASLSRPAKSNLVEVYISPNGNDANRGTRKAPLRSLEAARDAVRNRPAGTGATVYLLEGRHFRSFTFELDARDAGTASTPIVYKAAANAKVFLDGGRTVAPSACVAVTNKAILKRLVPKAKDHIRAIDLKAMGITDFGKVGPRGFSRSYRPAPLELFINNQPLEIARWPNKGKPHIAMGKVIDKGSVPRFGDYSFRGGIFEYNTPRGQRWTQAADLYISGIFAHGYAEDTIPVAKIDTVKGTIKTACPHLYGFGGKQKGLHKWYALNLLEEIDLPGEYCVDKASGILYFYPPFEINETALLQVSLLEEPMIAMEDVSYVHFENITFENTRGNGIYIEDGTSNLIAGCTFRNMGIVAVQIGQGSTAAADGYHNAHGEGDPSNLPKPVSRELGSMHNYIYDNTAWNRNGGTNHGVLSCDIYNTGAGGVVLGGGDRKTLTPAGNYVQNCDIHHVNRWDRTYKTPINIDGVGNKILHNDLHDCPGQAILLHGNDHLIEYNKMHDVLKDMSDQGAIYSGRDPSEAGTMIRYNFFYNLILGHTDGYGIQGIFFDDYGTYTATIFGNIFYKAGSTGVVKFFRGGESPIINNMIIDCPKPLEKLRCDHAKFLNFMHKDKLGIERVREAVDITKPPYSTKYPILKELYEDKRQLSHPFERNYVVKGDMSQFVDGINLNFQLKNDSSVYQDIQGFEKIPFEKIGLYLDEYRKDL